MPTRMIVLPNGQRFAIASISEAVSMIDCGVDELGQWISEGLVNAVQCPTCKFTYPLKRDLEELLSFAEQYPPTFSFDDIVRARFEEQVRQSERKPIPQRPLDRRRPERKTQPVRSRDVEEIISEYNEYNEEVTYETGPRPLQRGAKKTLPPLKQQERSGSFGNPQALTRRDRR